ncbi:ribokinase [Silanimonas sp.]|uniref:ribokinase n=1 Tax=Silanimonas sp. TaxID=1929290 RepID=UPI0022C6EAD3|nr:ribokinase [Silanimonas sp.]MCZ8064147.1 ribokinase [Silanimonas sp.]
MAGRVLVVGSYNQDLVWEVDALPAPGETRAGLAFRSGPGGKGFNQAVAAARAGAATTFIGALGDDTLAEGARALARAEGIDARFETIAGIATGTAGILVDAQGCNSIVVALGANARLTVAHVDAQAEAFSNAAVVLAPLESPLEAVRAAMRLGRAAGARTILNPAPMHADLDAAALADVDLLTPNETEMAELLARFGAGHVEAKTLRDRTDAELAALCARLPVRTVVITLGDAGAVLAPGARPGDDAPVTIARVPAAVVRAIDTTGAGDAFNGALAAAWAACPDADPATLLPFAIRFAGLSTERPGAAAAMPTRAELETRFAS